MNQGRGDELVPGSAEVVLCEEHHVTLRDSLVFEALDHLAGIGFVENAPPRTEFLLSKVFPNQAEGIGKASLKAVVFLDYGDDGFQQEPDRVCAVTIHSESTTNVEAREGIIDLAEAMSGEIDLDEEGPMEAWQILEYRFDSRDPQVYKDLTYELRSIDGEVRWSLSDEPEPKSREPDHIDEHEEIIEEREGVFMSMILGSDVDHIYGALLSLGMPQSLLLYESVRELP